MAANTRQRNADGGAARVVAGQSPRCHRDPAAGSGSVPAPDRPVLPAEVIP
jgi:hypothetical protein